MRSTDLKRVGPAVAILAVMVVPLVISAAGGRDKKGLADLRVERVLGSSTLMITVANELNTSQTALDGRTVSVEAAEVRGFARKRLPQGHGH